jgi:hypothetical protein
MTLFILNDTGGVGTGTVDPNAAEADLFTISKMDMGLGEETLANPANLIRVTYTQNEAGICPDRLDELVNTDFADIPGDRDIIVMAVGANFQLSDGTFVSPNAGTALPLGDSLNPTASVLVVYDPAPPVCVLAEDGSGTSFPGPVVLYHELSHALRMATSALLDLTAPSACGASPEENAAEIDENDMRDQMGLARRDATNHCGSVCGPAPKTCCIVASIATGGQSVELNTLRRLRDQFLRRSETGHAFFERLHYDYYAFSPQICTEMGNNPELVDRIARLVVRPLVRSLTLIHAHLMEDLPVEELGRLVASAHDGLERISRRELDAVFGLLEEGRAAEGAGASEHIRWALLDPVDMYLAAVADRDEGMPPPEIGRRLAGRMNRWAPEMPLTDVWSFLSDYDKRQELDWLERCLLRTAPAQRRFGERLTAYLETA